MLDNMHALCDSDDRVATCLLGLSSLHAVFGNWRGVVEEEAVFLLVKCSDFVLQNMDG
jgi:hypothetical protein